MTATQDLRRHLKLGSTVYTILRHVSRSGSTRHIDLLAIEVVNRGIVITPLAPAAATLLEVPLAPGGGLVYYHLPEQLVAALALLLFGDAAALKHRAL